jgi:hypothetical protein
MAAATSGFSSAYDSCSGRPAFGWVQTFNPAFTARTIFGLKDETAFAIVRRAWDRQSFQRGLDPACGA